MWAGRKWSNNEENKLWPLVEARQPERHMPAKRKMERTKTSRPIRHRTKSGDPKTLHAAKEDVERYLIAPTQQPAHIADVAALDVPTLLRTTRVLFYPASGFDWRPLIKFTTPEKYDCQTILYCDWHYEREHEFAAQLRNIPVALECESEAAITPDQITPASSAPPARFLHEDELARYRDRYRMFAVKKGWGRRVVLRGELGDGRVRRLNLIYLGAEGVATYLQVFNEQRIAPYMLCTVGCGVGFGFNWTDFGVYADALGRAVEANHSKPTYVINEGGQPYDWPWMEEVHAVDGMRVFKRFDAAGGNPAPPTSPPPQKYPNPFMRRRKPESMAGPMPKPKIGFGFFGLDQK